MLGATVSRTADRWFVAIQVEVPDAQFHRARTTYGVTGVDLGIKAAATFSSGEIIAAPKPLKAALRRLKIRGRRVSRKIETAKIGAGFAPRSKLPKGTRLPVTSNRKKSSATLARLHARIANVRADFTHKLTTRLCRENQATWGLGCFARRSNTRQNATAPNWSLLTAGIRAAACARPVTGKTMR